ncbi:unnamed protein product [Cylindrotheca closterium]|uniref:Uncharacterized protein n=1 Tax=Cylindrotheca closterium TaxID=2856 RepID=A0AAD2G9C0_9STRA|nr:unnamed protein product [Cylindrotheca closterium]
MFDCPEGTTTLAKEESIFSVLNWGVLASLLSPTTTIVEAAHHHIMDRLLKVASWERQGKISFHLVCNRVENMSQFIASKKPRTMSWSNVPDYMEYEDFHSLARACSVHDNTRHFGYSMNWVMDVFGVNILDYSGPKGAIARGRIIDGSNQKFEKLFKSRGWEKYLRLPIPNNPINISSSVLRLGQCKMWARHFFKTGQHQGYCQVLETKYDFGTPLSPAGAYTLHFDWTYDPPVKKEDPLDTCFFILLPWGTQYLMMQKSNETR